MTKAKMREILMTMLLDVCILVCTAFCDWGITAPIVFADTDGVQTRYEQTNVLNNFKGATLGGKKFDIKDYPHNELGKPQIISLVEFCYSYYADKQSDYGLYIYVYNPQDKPIDMTTERNKIQLTYGEKGSYEKYKLDFLNYSNEAGYEGRFYKYRISLTDTDKRNFLKELKADARVYKISGFELSVNNKVTEYTVAQTYTYKGFALGYGSELAESDTLSCTVDGLDKYLTLDVKSTYWRPQGTHDDLITRDTLHSVYFSVPNNIITDYGEMTGVHATWLNAYTNPVFVTGNKDVYLATESVLGKEIRGGDLDNYTDNVYGYSLLALDAPNPTDTSLIRNYSGLHYGFNNFEQQSKHTVGGDGHYVHHKIGKQINELNYLFYADNGDADSYILPASKLIGDETIKGWFDTYTDRFGGEKVNGRYSKALFEKADNAFTNVNIRSTDSYKLQDKIYSWNFWDILFGDHLQQEHSYEMQAIQKVTVQDISTITDKEIFCDKFYIASSDYDEFTEYVYDSAEKGETVYLFRYYQSEYVSAEVTEAKRYYHNKAAFKSCMFHSDCAFGHGYYDEIDTNAYFAQMWVQLDFDIIDLTFTKNGVITIIPVIMSPMDIAADADHPVYIDDDKIEWWQILLIVLLVILLLWLLLKFAPGIFTVIIKIVIFPFKVIGMLFSAIWKQIQPIHERNKQRCAENKARRKAERERTKQIRLAEKERERQEKSERKAQEKQERRKQRVAQKERKREQKRDMRTRKQAQRNYEEYVKYEEFPWSDKKPKRLLRKEQRQEKKKLTLADLEGMSDAELADLYYEEYGDEEFDIPDFDDE